MSLVLYGYWRSSSSWRVRIGLNWKGLPYAQHSVHLAKGEQNAPGWQEKSPLRTVPLLEWESPSGTRQLTQSLAILEYLDEIAPTKTLFPGDAKNRARIRRLVLECKSHLDDKGLGPLFQEAYMKPAGEAPDEAKINKAREIVIAELEYFARQLQGNFLAGEAPTAVDFAVYTEVAYVKRMAATKPATKLAGVLKGSMADWVARIEALPYFDKTFPPHWRG